MKFIFIELSLFDFLGITGLMLSFFLHSPEVWKIQGCVFYCHGQKEISIYLSRTQIDELAGGRSPD